MAAGVFVNRIERSPDGLRFRASLQSLLLGGLLAVLWLLLLVACVSAFVHPPRSDAAAEQVGLMVVLLVLGGFVVKVARAGTLVADRSGIRCSSLLRSHRWAWPEIAGFEEVVLVIRPNSPPRRYVRVHLMSGRAHNLADINASSRDDPGSIRQLVAALEELRVSAPRR